MSLDRSKLSGAAAVTTALVIKAADEAVTSSTVLQDDNELTFAIGANETWYFRAVLHARGATTGDIKVGVTAPAGATKRYYGAGNSGGTTGGSGNLALASQTTDGLTLASFETMASDATFDTAIVMEGVVSNGSTAGSVTIQWAQATSSATATTVLAKSTLWAAKA